MTWLPAHNGQYGHRLSTSKAGIEGVAKDVLDFIKAAFLNQSSLHEFAMPTKPSFCGNNVVMNILALSFRPQRVHRIYDGRSP